MTPPPPPRSRPCSRPRRDACSASPLESPPMRPQSRSGVPAAEVLGKHTDCGALLRRGQQGFAVVTTARSDGKCRIFTQFSDGREQQELVLTPDTAELERPRRVEPIKEAKAYPAAAIQRLTANFGMHGADMGIECSLPEASGMPSSSAVICYMWSVLDAWDQCRSTPYVLKEHRLGCRG